MPFAVAHFFTADLYDRTIAPNDPGGIRSCGNTAWRRSMLRLYGNNRINRPMQYPNDSVHMIWHDDKFVNFCICGKWYGFHATLIRQPCPILKGVFYRHQSFQKIGPDFSCKLLRNMHLVMRNRNPSGEWIQYEIFP
jgi:hypothetical protein